jgi:hypothetical protein
VKLVGEDDPRFHNCVEEYLRRDVTLILLDYFVCSGVDDGDLGVLVHKERVVG